MSDLSHLFQQQVQDAIKQHHSLQIIGSNSKRFYGGNTATQHHILTRDHQGIIDYEPSELVISARSGTRLADLNAVLNQHQQMLGFEPPQFGADASLGGTMACGFSGPRRPFTGSARDFTLGCKLLNGHGEILNFGGRVMKNVAGFDVSRLMVGALGSLGMLLEVSLRVLPMPETELSLSFDCSEARAIAKMAAISAQPWPLSGLAYDGQRLKLRLSGAESAVKSAAQQLGGDLEPNPNDFWLDLREQQLDFFHQPGDLWRISLAPASPVLNLAGSSILDWGGGLRWLKTEQTAAEVHAAIAETGGHAIAFRAEQKTDWIRFEPALLAIQQQLRQAFDPWRIFNPGRLLD